MAEAPGALDVIGLIADLVGLGSLASDAFQPVMVSGTQVNLKLGFGDGKDGVTGFDGQLGAVYAFDYSNNYLGEGEAADGDEPIAGSVVHYTVDQEVPDKQGRYISVSTMEDDICIVLVTVNQHDGGYTGNWNGDIGFHCGQAWYHGGDVEGTINGTDWAPRCTWFGGTVTPEHVEPNTVENAAFKFNTVAYASAGNQTIADGDDAICGATIYAAEGGVINDQPGGADPATKKRSTRTLPLPATRKDWMESTLIVSNHTSQTAEQLCSHGMSYGPDFVDSDGNYCDMKTKTLSPVCTGSDTTGCVTLSDDSKTITKRSSVARRTVDAVHKTYGKVQHWGPK